MPVLHAEVLTRFGHALSDPTRTRLLLTLREGPGYPSELAEQLDAERFAAEEQARVMEVQHTIEAGRDAGD